MVEYCVVRRIVGFKETIEKPVFQTYDWKQVKSLVDSYKKRGLEVIVYSRGVEPWKVTKEFYYV